MLAKLERIIRDAGEVILSKHSALKVTAKEGHANFVTDMDVSIQQFLLGVTVDPPDLTVNINFGL